MIIAPPLACGTVHVWFARLDLPEPAVARLLPLLSQEEQARAGRFRLERDRRRSIVGRATLRQVLGAYTATAPGDVRFAYGARGKPELAGSASCVAFNLSHSHEMAAVAVAREGRVGIDLEQIRPVAGESRIARRYFSPQEIRALEDAPPEARLEAFLRAWTAKEAFLKALGTGFFSPLNRIALPVPEGARPCCTRLPGPDGHSVPWTFFALPPAGEYAGTVAVEGEAASLECFKVAPPAG